MSSKLKIIIPAIIAIVAIIVAVLNLGIPKSTEADIDSMMSTAQTYLLENKYEQAIAEFKKIIELDPDNADAYLGLARAYHLNGETEKAIETLEEGYEITGDPRLKEFLDELLALINKQETTAETTEPTTVSETETTPLSSEEPDTMPELMGLRMGEAVSLCELAGIEYEIKQIDNPYVEFGFVAGQSVSAGSTINENTSVAIFVSGQKAVTSEETTSAISDTKPTEQTRKTTAAETTTKTTVTTTEKTTVSTKETTKATTEETTEKTTKITTETTTSETETEPVYIEEPEINIWEFEGGKKVELTCSDRNAVIYYTLDGSSPDKYSNKYRREIELTRDTTVKAVAFYDKNYSDTVTKLVSVPKSKKPTANIDSDSKVESGTEIRLSAGADETIYYSVNDSYIYEYTSPIIIYEDTEINAYSVKDGAAASDTVYFYYTVEEKTYTVSGRVSLTGSYNEFLSGVTVTLTNNSVYMSDITDADGYFCFNDVKEGNYTITYDCGDILYKYNQPGAENYSIETRSVFVDDHITADYTIYIEYTVSSYLDMYLIYNGNTYFVGTVVDCPEEHHQPLIKGLRESYAIYASVYGDDLNSYFAADLAAAGFVSGQTTTDEMYQIIEIMKQKAANL